MTGLLPYILGLAITASPLSTVSGAIVDHEGAAIVGARVFLEQGLVGAVIETRSDVEGAFEFHDVVPGVVGVFAIASDHAWGGQSVSLGQGTELSGIRIALREPDTVDGEIIAGKKDRVEGARITRVALLSGQPVSIPLSKMRPFGFQEPQSDARGRFRIESLPARETVALKIVHPSFAQRAVSNVTVGDSVDVQMYEGVLITGSVVAQGTGSPVGMARVLLRNAAPPHDTIIAQSDQRGGFAIRVLPGQYAYQAAGPAYRSGGWKPLTVDMESTIQELRLEVSATGRVIGRVMDAKSGEPVSGARFLLSTEGIPAATARTGQDGRFSFSAASGETVVALDEAHGFQLPPSGATRFQLMENQVVDLPTFWIAPLSELSLAVVDDAGNPQPGALLRLVRPTQFGSFVTDSDGSAQLRISSVPADGHVLGVVEHPTQAYSALFRLSASGSNPSARVQLIPASTIVGTVVDGRDRGIAGAVVLAMYAEEEFDDPIVLARAITDREGRYSIAGVPGQIPIALTARSVDEPGAASPYETIIVPPGESAQVSLRVDVSGQHGGESMMGRRLELGQFDSLCEDEGSSVSSAVAIFGNTSEADALVGVYESVAQRYPDFRFAVVIDGFVDCSDTDIDLRRGVAPGTATVYVTDTNGRVVYEGMNLPPAFALENLQR